MQTQTRTHHPQVEFDEVGHCVRRLVPEDRRPLRHLALLEVLRQLVHLRLDRRDPVDALRAQRVTCSRTYTAHCSLSDQRSAATCELMPRVSVSAMQRRRIAGTSAPSLYCSCFASCCPNHLRCLRAPQEKSQQQMEAVHWPAVASTGG